MSLVLFRVCAVPEAAVRCTGLSHVSPMFDGAAAKHALALPTAVFAAETLAERVGGASLLNTLEVQPSTEQNLPPCVVQSCPL